MKTDEIKLLWEYNNWADRRILATCAKVSAEQYAASTAYGNLRDTLIHTLDAQWVWRLGCQKFIPASGKADAPAAEAWNHQELTSADLPTLDVLTERWQAEEGAMRAFLASLRDEDMYGFVRYLIPGGIVRERLLWHCLLHAVNHGTQHRSEAAVLLTAYGQSPGELDFTRFLNEHFNLPR